MELPDFLKNDTTRLSEGMVANLGMSSPPYVSIMGNRFTLFDSAGDEEPVTTVDQKTGMFYLDCVIIDRGDHPSKIFYAKPFDQSASSFSPPDCWSDNGIAPSINASLPQNVTCAGCPQAVWGSKTSATSGKGIPACAKYQKLALALPGDDVVFLLRVPPNSLENLRAYNKKFVGQQIDISQVVTRVSFEKDTLGTLTFQAVAFIDQPMLTFKTQVRSARGTDDLVGRNDQPIAQLAAPATKAEIAAPAAAQQQITQQPAQQAVIQQAAAEAPRRRRGRPAAAEAGQAAMGAQAAPFRPSAPPSGDVQQSQMPFGIGEGVKPNAELSNALKDAGFGEIFSPT